MLKSRNHYIFGSWKGWLEVEALDAGFIEQMDQHCWAIPRQIFFSKTWSNNKNNSWVDWKWEFQKPVIVQRTERKKPSKDHSLPSASIKLPSKLPISTPRRPFVPSERIWAHHWRDAAVEPSKQHTRSTRSHRSNGRWHLKWPRLSVPHFLKHFVIPRSSKKSTPKSVTKAQFTPDPTAMVRI